MARCNIVALSCFALILVQFALAVPGPDELTFPQLRDKWNTTGQFRIQLATSNEATPGVWTPVNCSNPLLGACLPDGKRPLEQNQGDLVRVTYTLTPRGPFRTYESLKPTTVEIRFCYSVNVSVNRAWRTKYKPFPRLSLNCPFIVAELPFNGTVQTPDVAANSGSVIFDFNSDKANGIAKATFFTMIWVRCGDQVCAFQSTEGRNDLSPPVPGNFFETQPYMGITTGMIASAAILSAVGPIFLVVYFFADRRHYQTKGKPLTF